MTQKEIVSDGRSMPSNFTGVQAAGILSLSYRQIDYWLGHMNGYNPGSGQPRTLPLETIYLLAVVREMRSVGITLPDAIQEAQEILDSDLNVAQWSPSPMTHVSIDIQSLKEQIDEAIFESLVSKIKDYKGRTGRRFH